MVTDMNQGPHRLTQTFVLTHVDMCPSCTDTIHTQVHEKKQLDWI